jgi:Tol biopolymer transport system component
MLVYTTGMTGRKLFLVDRATGHQVRVPGVRNSAMAALSPDASSIVYQAERRNGRYDLWLQPLQNGRPSGDPHPLADHPGVPSHPVFSADGRWLAYYLIENNQRDIWVVSMMSGEAIRITDDPHQNQQPAWSSDGRALVFISERDGRSRIRVVAIDEGRPVGESIEIMTEDIDAFHPVWLPIENSIAFVGRRRGEQEVWVVRADGSKPPYRITSGGSIMTVRWDPLENNLLASGLWGGSTMTIRSVSLETGETVPLSPVVDFGSADSPGMFDVSADGRWVVYPYEEDKGDVWVLEAAKGSY